MSQEVLMKMAATTALLSEANLRLIHHLCSFLRRVDGVASKMTVRPNLQMSDSVSKASSVEST